MDADGWMDGWENSDIIRFVANFQYEDQYTAL